MGRPFEIASVKEDGGGCGAAAAARDDRARAELACGCRADK